MDENNKLILAVQERTPEEQREISSKAGKASGVARRRKRDMKKAMLEMLNQPVMVMEIYNNTSLMGFDPDDITYQSAIIAAMIREAASGNVKAFQAICNLIGAGNEGDRIALLREDHRLKKKELEQKKEDKDKTEGTGVIFVSPVLPDEEDTE